ncbi:MAG: HEAT repeat domain-containing protein, partial [Planctomycetes bacterium]|nr:HEAT repeat domain-containing protein [Planctomycetota bacterium]
MRPLTIGPLLAALVSGSLLAQGTDKDAEQLELERRADRTRFERWFEEYESGASRLVKDGKIDEVAVGAAKDKIVAVARWQRLDDAHLLFRAATTDPSPPGARTSADKIEFHAELLPWRIRAIAREAIAGIAADEVEPWLVALVHGKNLRDAAAVADRAAADAALQILGMRDSESARTAVLEATMRLPPKLRTRALDVLSDFADLSVVPHFIELLRDRDPNMRIAALNAIGKALGPHTDETEHSTMSKDVEKHCATALDAMRNILKKDKVWQVRAAACHSLAQLKTSKVIPVLIDGLDAELRRKKDPWAMDVRLHRTLEHLTGQSVPLGSTAPWRSFWSKEKGRFRFAKPGEADARNAASSDGEKYEKFFALDLSSDRVLFLLDFSGSMDEPITLKTELTSTKPGQTIVKAKLVVEEMKKLIMSLPDGAIFNLIVFSDDVRVWRPDGEGRPLPVKLDDSSRDDLLGSFLDNLSPQGPTNLYGALDRAIGLAGRGIDDGSYTAEFDTLYVLSDGAPTYGEIRDKDRIRELVRDANRLKQLTIHSVT